MSIVKYKLEGKSGIYKLTNIVNNKIYIGSSKKLQIRIINHFSGLKNNTHPNSYLQNSYNKYGDVFNFEILEYCSNEDLIIKEQFYIDTLKPEYNILQIAQSASGYKHTEQFKINASIRMKNSISKGLINPKLANAKLNDNIVKLIVNDIKALSTVKSILIKYNLNRNTFNIILKRESWKHITNNLTDEDLHKHKEYQRKEAHKGSGRKKITDLQCLEIRELFKNGVSAINIAKQYNLHRDGVYYILKERKLN